MDMLNLMHCGHLVICSFTATMQRTQGETDTAGFIDTASAKNTSLRSHTQGKKSNFSNFSNLISNTITFQFV